MIIWNTVKEIIFTVMDNKDGDDIIMIFWVHVTAELSNDWQIKES